MTRREMQDAITVLQRDLVEATGEIDDLRGRVWELETARAADKQAARQATVSRFQSAYDRAGHGV